MAHTDQAEAVPAKVDDKAQKPKKAKLPPSVKLEEVLANVASAPGNDDEIEALRDIIGALTCEMGEDQIRIALSGDMVKGISKRAKRWAKAGGGL